MKVWSFLHLLLKAHGVGLTAPPTSTHFPLKSIRILFSACHCLYCLHCRSSISWEDCNQHVTEEKCDETDMVCYMHHRILLFGHRYHHRFVKSCYFLESCSAETCRQTEIKNVNSSWCEVKCCDHENFCNKGVTPSWEARNGQSINLPFSAVLLLGLLCFY